MPATLWVVHNSHPCNTVLSALALKGVAHRVVELPPGIHAGVMKLVFGGRTVPAIRFEDGEKVQGSSAILRALDARVPSPPLLPADPVASARTLEAERWGDGVLQPAVRRILWPTLLEHPSAAPSFSEGARLPLPGAITKALIPAIGRLELKLNDTGTAERAEDLAKLPAMLDLIDAWLADGTLGGAEPYAADLQIAASLALLVRMEDVRLLAGARPCVAWAERLIPNASGHLPAGSIPASALPSPSAA